VATPSAKLLEPREVTSPLGLYMLSWAPGATDFFRKLQT
jgi:hypothetical protein